jgi:hypothetical protein
MINYPDEVEAINWIFGAMLGGIVRKDRLVRMKLSQSNTGFLWMRRRNLVMG